VGIFALGAEVGARTAFVGGSGMIFGVRRGMGVGCVTVGTVESVGFAILRHFPILRNNF
jgi:hypothetical protein